MSSHETQVDAWCSFVMRIVWKNLSSTPSKSISLSCQKKSAALFIHFLNKSGSSLILEIVIVKCIRSDNNSHPTPFSPTIRGSRSQTALGSCRFSLIFAVSGDRFSDGYGRGAGDQIRREEEWYDGKEEEGEGGWHRTTSHQLLFWFWFSSVFTFSECFFLHF